MNHGGLGHLAIEADKATLTFPPELLEHSFVRREGRMYGIYYKPGVRGRSRYKGLQMGHDLMLTPIPYRFWPRAARLTLRIRHEPRMIHMVSSFLADNDISIIQSESTRSGYRYETWSFYIVFEDLGDTLTWDRHRHVYRETYDRLAQLVKDLRRECDPVLFVDRGDVDLRAPVTKYHNTALGYFYRYAETCKSRGSHDTWMHSPFKLDCKGAGTLVSRGDLVTILERLPDLRLDAESPTVVFAGMDARYLNIRTAIIPPSRLHRFIEVSIDYTRSGNPDTCIGLISRITSLFPWGYNIWSSHNRTFESKEIRERGRIVFLIEDQDANGKTAAQVEAEARALFSTLNERIQFDDERTIRFQQPRVTSVTPELVLEETQRQARERQGPDVFISHRHQDVDLARKVKESLEKIGFLTCYLAEEEMKSGARLADSIREAIRGCREMCVICTPGTFGSEWIRSEIAAAWVLGKTIVPVMAGMPTEELPPPLNSRHAVPISRCNAYARDARLRIDGSQRG